MERGGGITAEPPGDDRRVTVVVPDELAGGRLDRALTTLLPELSRSRIKRLIVAGAVTSDGAALGKPSVAVEAGQRLEIDLPVAAPIAEPTPRDLALNILYEDNDVAAIDKPAGLVVHAGAGEHRATLVDGLLHRYGDALSSGGGDGRPGIVHRLDVGTSGVILVARTDAAHAALTGQFAMRTVEKEYAAVVYGCPSAAEGEIDLPIGRDRNDRTKISPRTDRPREALTRWQLDEDLGGFALLRVLPKTGRMHQVRVHLTALHHPCVGDPKYAGAQWKSVANPLVRKAVREFPRPALHARRIRVAHPTTGEPLEVVAPLPDDLESLLATLRITRAST